MIGAIGVIGPRRMKYNKVISMLDYLSRGVGGMLDPEQPPGLGDGISGTETGDKE